MIEETLVKDKIWDLCIVGTGPVGMSMALEFESLGRDVLVLEAGELAINPALSEASRAEIVSPETQAPMEIAVVRALGGTSWTWGGRSVAYDDVDWMPRGFVQDAEWPLTHDELRPWYKPATKYLLAGNDTFEIPYKRALTDGLTLDFVERWARDSRVINEHRAHLLGSSKIHISLKTTVTALNPGPN